MNVVRGDTRLSLRLPGLLFLLGLALMLIVGLLGMHTFSGDVSGHGAPATADSSVAVTAGTDHAMAADHGATSADCAGACATGSGGDHMSMATVCVLALLTGLLLILPPILLDRLNLRRLLQAPSWRSTAGARLPNPPSLIFLSISRT